MTGQQQPPAGWASQLLAAYALLRQVALLRSRVVDRNLLEITYKARATNVGDFIMPAAYAEAMYDRRVFARSASGRFQVTAN